MLIKASSRKAQSIMEYLGVAIAIIAALIFAGLYYQRSLQGKYRQAADAIGGGEQYTR